MPAQSVLDFYPSDTLPHSTEHVGLTGVKPQLNVIRKDVQKKKGLKIKALNPEAVFAFQRLSCLEPGAESLSLAFVIAV